MEHWLFQTNVPPEAGPEPLQDRPEAGGERHAVHQRGAGLPRRLAPAAHPGALGGERAQHDHRLQGRADTNAESIWVILSQRESRLWVRFSDSFTTTWLKLTQLNLNFTWLKLKDLTWVEYNVNHTPRTTTTTTTARIRLQRRRATGFWSPLWTTKLRLTFKAFEPFEVLQKNQKVKTCVYF